MFCLEPGSCGRLCSYNRRLFVPQTMGPHWVKPRFVQGLRSGLGSFKNCFQGPFRTKNLFVRCPCACGRRRLTQNAGAVFVSSEGLLLPAHSARFLKYVSKFFVLLDARTPFNFFYPFFSQRDAPAHARLKWLRRFHVCPHEHGMTFSPMTHMCFLSRMGKQTITNAEPYEPI